jgi:hypothetical protein
MSYDTPEASVKDGRPYFLYQFASSAGTTRLTSEPVDLTRDAGDGDVTWTASPISHDKMEQNGNVEKQEIELTFPLSDTFAAGFLVPATAITTLTVFRGHYTDLTDELRTIWKGRVVGAHSGGQTITMLGESIFTSLRRTGCTARVQRTCRHALYLPGCNLDKADFAVSATATSINGLTVTVTEAADEPDSTYSAGMIEWNGRFGFIASHFSTSLHLVSEIPGFEDEVTDNAPVSITIYPGCDRSLTVCNGTFSNLLNNGSFAYRPPNNPFSQSIV